MEDFSIHTFTVNGRIGPNVMVHSGGGETCCVSLPAQWRPGLKARISWAYDKNDRVSKDLPAPQTAEVEIPKYSRSGAFQVHFYKNHRVKIVVSSCDPDHPFYPMNATDLAPWRPLGTKEDMREAAQRGGGTVDC